MKWERYQVLLNLSPHRSSLHWSDLLIILRRTIGRRTEIKKQKRNMKTSTIDPYQFSYIRKASKSQQSVFPGLQIHF